MYLKSRIEEPGRRAAPEAVRRQDEKGREEAMLKFFGAILGAAGVALAISALLLKVVGEKRNQQKEAPSQVGEAAAAPAAQSVPEEAEEEEEPAVPEEEEKAEEEAEEAPLEEAEPQEQAPAEPVREEEEKKPEEARQEEPQLAIEKGKDEKDGIHACLKSLEKQGARVLFHVRMPGGEEADALMIHSGGIYVIRREDCGGKIFGSDQQKTWECRDGEKRKKLESPVEKNQAVVMALWKQLKKADLPVYSLVVFPDSADLSDVETVAGSAEVVSEKDLEDSLREYMAYAGQTLGQKEADSIWRQLSSRAQGE